MEDFWFDIDSAILGRLDDDGGTTPAEIARALRISEGAASSLLARLAQEGKVTIVRVELPETR